MTTIEKLIIGVTTVLLISIVVGATYLVGAIEDAAGLKAIATKAGKDAKSITTEIQAEVVQGYIKPIQVINKPRLPLSDIVWRSLPLPDV